MKKKPTSIRYLLHKTLARSEPARDHSHVHASDLLKKDLFHDLEFCPRHYALLDTLKRQRPPQFIHAAHAKVFGEGNTTANWIIHTLADAGLIVGHWECKYCHHEYKFCKRPAECKECCHTEFKYIEVRFRSRESDIGGGIDGLLDLGRPKLVIGEFKTMQDEDFKKLVAPLAEHKYRTNLYMRLVEDSKSKYRHLVDTKEAVVLYQCKGGFGGKQDDLIKEGITDSVYSPFKEFKIQRDDSITQTKWDHAKALKDFRDGKTGIPLGLCSTSMCPRAKNCDTRHECFSSAYKSEDT